MTEPFIQVSGVTKGFNHHKVVADLSFEVGRGEIVGLLGPNGSGKTTTIRLLNGVLTPEQGEIRVSGLNPQKDGDAIRRLSGILTESAGFYVSLSGLENLRFFADLYGVTDPRRPLALLEEFGLGPNRDQKVGTYSTGMKKRLGIAKALLHRPEILFLDEPTNGLDPEGIRMVLTQIRELNRRDSTTIILCSHLLQQLETVCHRYLFIGGGRVIEQGTHAELEAKYVKEVVLEVETDLQPTGDAFEGCPVTRLPDGKLALRLPGRQAVPQVLRSLTQAAAVYGAAVRGQDLESLYFKIREVAAHE